MWWKCKRPLDIHVSKQAVGQWWQNPCSCLKGSIHLQAKTSFQAKSFVPGTFQWPGIMAWRKQAKSFVLFFRPLFEDIFQDILPGHNFRTFFQGIISGHFLRHISGHSSGHDFGQKFRLLWKMPLAFWWRIAVIVLCLCHMTAYLKVNWFTVHAFDSLPL